jgi:hypothetical protein
MFIERLIFYSTLLSFWLGGMPVLLALALHVTSFLPSYPALSMTSFLLTLGVIKLSLKT